MSHNHPDEPHPRHPGRLASFFNCLRTISRDRQHIQTLRGRIEHLEAKKRSLEHRLRSVRRERNTARTESETLRWRRNTLETENAELRETVNQLRDAEALLREEMRRMEEVAGRNGIQGNEEGRESVMVRTDVGSAIDRGDGSTWPPRESDKTISGVPEENDEASAGDGVESHLLGEDCCAAQVGASMESSGEDWSCAAQDGGSLDTRDGSRRAGENWSCAADDGRK
ncbi:hypothetical protein K402DRAFT_240102 [Aulographum hederae CBS 113979]|uniref:Uncharacterized protein n=1 Tax=Aulographum hederae CBS 113979 TaxID=1176131 RepID=A0A6G1GKM5_9PEZI|nr:hypothetical protein K402DRAFT_240102 [Aulographum hederae CBS 113979]